MRLITPLTSSPGSLTADNLNTTGAHPVRLGLRPGYARSSFYYQIGRSVTFPEAVEINGDQPDIVGLVCGALVAIGSGHVGVVVEPANVISLNVRFAVASAVPSTSASSSGDQVKTDPLASLQRNWVRLFERTTSALASEWSGCDLKLFATTRWTTARASHCSSIAGRSVLSAAMT